MDSIAEDKSGKIKFTFEVDINPPMMELIREDVDIMTDLMAKGLAEARKQMQQQRSQQKGGPMGWGQGGHGGVGYMHHGMGYEGK